MLPIMADEQADRISNWVLALTGILGLLGSAFIWLWNAVGAKRKTTITELQGMVEDERKLRYREQARNANLDVSFRKMFVFYCDARTRAQEYYILLDIYSSTLKRQDDRLKSAGQNPEYYPAMPEKPKDNHKQEADFLVNTVAQERISAESIKAATKQVFNPPHSDHSEKRESQEPDCDELRERGDEQ